MTLATDEKRARGVLSERAYPSPAYAHYVLGVLTLVYVFAFIDRQILNLLVGPIRSDLLVSDTQFSLLSGFGFALFYAIFGLPLARIADSRSRRGLIAVGFAMWSLFTGGCGLARNFTQLLIMRMGVGVGEASLSPAAYSLITDYFPPDRRATAQGIYNMGIFLGAGVAYILSGTVIGLVSTRLEYVLPFFGSVRPWQLVFFVVGLPGLLFSLLMFTVAEPVRRGAQPGMKKVSLRELVAFIRTNRVTFVSHNLGSALLFFSAYGSAAWIPSFFIRHHQWSAALTGQVLGLTILFSALGVACGGWFADVIAKRGYRDACMRVALLSSLLWIPTGVGYLLVPNPIHAAILLAPSLFIAATFLGVAPAALMEIAPARMRSQVGALYLFVGNLIGLGIGPTAVALFTDYVFRDDNMVGYSILTVSLAAHLLAAFVFWIGLKPFVRSKERAIEATTVGL